MPLKRTTIAALVAAAIGTTALATTALANNSAATAAGTAAGNGSSLGPQLQQQSAGTNQLQGPGAGFGVARNMPTRPGFPGGFGQWAHRGGMSGPGMNRPGMMGPRGTGGAGTAFLTLACSPRGAEAIELRLVRLSYRLDLSADQQKLLDTLKTDALSAQSDFAAQCKSLMPARGTNTAAADPLQRFKNRLTLEQDRLDAMNKLMPDIDSFYSSLTDAQKAKLAPQRRHPGQRPSMIGRMQHPVDAPHTPLAPTAPDPSGSTAPAIING
ncbi:MAG TPA: Spy/CpxP family protein refolding chaperone [Alphaproteobacteria bacterium]|nr:Spy/CpxP family protein refolding chaperone [Alphaproteobacteria bacterium]